MPSAVLAKSKEKEGSADDVAAAAGRPTTTDCSAGWKAASLPHERRTTDYKVIARPRYDRPRAQSECCCREMARHALLRVLCTLALSSSTQQRTSAKPHAAQPYRCSISESSSSSGGEGCLLSRPAFAAAPLAPCCLRPPRPLGPAAGCAGMAGHSYSTRAALDCACFEAAPRPAGPTRASSASARVRG